MWMTREEGDSWWVMGYGLSTEPYHAFLYRYLYFYLYSQDREYHIGMSLDPWSGWRVGLSTLHILSH